MLVAGIYKGADINDKLTVSSPDELLDELEDEVEALLDKELEELTLLLEEIELDELELGAIELDEIELLLILLEELEVAELLLSLELSMLEEVVLFSLLVKDSLDELMLELDELVAGVQEAMISANNVGTILLIFICGNNILVK